jgi:hypothetical protein
MNDLSPEMQSRLDEWRKNTQSVSSAEKVRGKSPGNRVPIQRDYGDDIRDYEKKEAAAWALEVQNNTMYRGYYDRYR